MAIGSDTAARAELARTVKTVLVFYPCGTAATVSEVPGGVIPWSCPVHEGNVMACLKERQRGFQNGGWTVGRMLALALLVLIALAALAVAL